jgi:hypothetical protein
MRVEGELLAGMVPPVIVMALHGAYAPAKTNAARRAAVLVFCPLPISFLQSYASLLY